MDQKTKRKMLSQHLTGTSELTGFQLTAMPLVMRIWWHQPKNISTAPGKLGKRHATLPRSERGRLAWAALGT